MTEEQVKTQDEEQNAEQGVEQNADQGKDQKTDAPEMPHKLTQEELDSMTYFEYLKFLNPDKSDEEVEAMVRKENRSVWLVRFEILAFLLIIIAIIWVVFFS